MKVTLTDEELQAHIEKALIASLSAEARERMIGDALAWLTTPQKDPYYRNASPLQRAVQSSMEVVAARWIVAEMEREGSEFHKLLTDVILSAVVQMRESDQYKKVGEKFAEALAKVFEPRY